ncbi:branched-chain amino acid ABC transporter permease [Anaerovibrio slackiae]|uniref:branched-chain amino acid ABC transporter permease n=1 Tax=Anaerovibrio slackiae TaxID=2652309 RepID=UPI00386FE1D0
MYVDAQTIITAGAVLTALVGFVTLGWKLFKWINHQKEQDQEITNIKVQHTKDIADLKTQHAKDMAEVKAMHHKDTEGIQEEQTLVVYGLLACLKGLAEQGCDGPVSEAIDRIEKHINKKAHGQE